MVLGDKCVVPAVKGDRGSVWAQYTVRVKNRDEFSVRMKEQGVPTSVHYPSPMHHQPVYAHLKPLYSLPVAEEAARHVISLPMWPDMTTEQVDQVIGAVKASV
jgi:UDP-2-acetamido-2-deoxy-ribo-hexuluronate aminotransferase